MTNLEILRNQKRLDYLFTKFDALTEDYELLSHWSRYLCVLVSGYLEESIRILLREYSKTKSTPYVANYVETKLNSFCNPKMGIILGLTGAFSQEWQKNIETAVKGEIKSSVDSIVDIRHKIAHGKNVGITPSILKNYYRNAKKLIRLLEHQCYS